LAFAVSKYGYKDLWIITQKSCYRAFNTNYSFIREACFSPDGQKMAVVTNENIQIYDLHFELEFPGWQDWDEGVRPFLDYFLDLYPEWTDKEFYTILIPDLQNRGYGWLRPESVRSKLKKMTPSRIKKTIYSFLETIFQYKYKIIRLLKTKATIYLTAILAICFLANLLVVSNRGLSGKYKHEESGQIMEFISSSKFKIQNPDESIVTGTYQKTKEGYELKIGGGSVVELAKKDGKTFIMNAKRYVKQKGNVKIPTYLFVIYGVVAFTFFVFAFWGYFNYVNHDAYNLLLTGLFWPIVLILGLLVIFIWLVLCFITRNEKMPNLDPYQDMYIPREDYLN